MGGCKYFIANTYFGIFTTTIISLLSVKLNLLDRFGLGSHDFKTEAILFICALTTLFLLVNMEMGLMKFATFYFFIFLIEGLFHKIVHNVGVANILSDTLTVLSTVVLAITVLAFIDKYNDFPLSVYMVVCLGAMILARLGINLVVFLGYPQYTISTTRYIISTTVALVMSVLMAFNTVRLKRLAETCEKDEKPPDYIQNAIEGYITLLNMVVDTKRITNKTKN